MRKFILTALLIASFTWNFHAQEGARNEMAPKSYNFKSFEPPTREVNSEMITRTPEQFRSNPDYGVLPYNVQCQDCYELIAERTAMTRRYVKKGTNGTTIYSQAGANPINYQDEQGNWRAIDPRMFPTGEANVFAAKNQPSPTYINLAKHYVSVQNGQSVISFNKNLKLFLQSESGNKTLIASADWTHATAGNDGMEVKDIFPGINLVTHVVDGGLKSGFVINNPLSYTAGKLLIEDELSLPAGAALGTEVANATEDGFRGVLTVKDVASGKRLFEIGEAVAFDNSDHRINASQPLDYRVDANKLSIVVPVKWLNTNGLTYPLTIDPLVTSSNTMLQGSISGSGGNGSGSFVAASACPYTLVVPSPANTTITDVLWSFTYIAQNGAVRNEGAVDFLYNACRSPIQPTFYWFCNVPTAGQCVGTNISIFSDIQSCIPAPACTPYNMSFTMRFYDRFGAACSNTFIGANSNWVMTVQGQTIAYTNPGSEISVSASTICFGQNITASAAMQYGVPGYNYNWSFNSSGTPSIATGSPATINFPSPGTYTLYSQVTDACAQTVTASTVITVNPSPSLTVTANTTPICLGQSSTLTASGATTYSWSANAGGGTGSTKNVTPGVGTTVYTVTGTASGCSSTSTVAVTVNPNPTVSATANPTSICTGQTATLTPNGATTYTWSSNEGGTSNNPTTVTPGSTTTYTVTGTDNNGCGSSGQVTVTIIPPPSLTVTPSSATVCAGSAASCTVTGATSYTWSSNAGSVTTATLSVSPSTTDTYTVTGNNGSCTSQATFVVNVNPLPTLTVSSTPASICSGDTATLSVSGASTYTWSANAGGGSASSLTVAPTSNTTYTVAGTLNGCSDSTTITLTVGSQPVVTVSASDSTICAGQTTTLTAAGATNYTWLPNGSGTTTTVTPSSSTTYTLIGDNGGCADTTFLLVNVNPLPTISAVASQTAICAGQSDTLTAGGGLTYSWSSNAGSATTSTVVVTPGTTDTFTVTGTDNNGCSNMATVTATVNPLPTVTVNSSTICSGQQTATLTANGASTYSWSNAQTGTTITVTPTFNTNYTVVGTDANGCSNQAVASVTVNQPPTITVTNSSPICNGQQTATLTASGAMVYTWTPTSGLTPPIGGTVSANPGTTTTYTVTGIDFNGCIGTAATTVTVNQLPTVTASVTPGTICSGSSATLSAGGAAGYQWSANAGSSTNQNTTVTPSATGTYTVTGTDANGCTNTATVSLVVNATPTLQPVSNAAGCAGSGISANFNSSGGATVNWTNSNTNIGLPASGSGSINFTAPNVTTTETGVITATPVANGCTGASQTFTITVYPKPTVTGGTPDTARCSMPTGSVTGTSVNGNGPFTYQWYSGSTAISGANTSTLTAQPAGTYSLLVTDANGCSAGTSAITIPGTNSVNAAFVPSPTTGIAPLNVSFTNMSTGATSYNWNFGNGSGSPNQNPSTTYNTGGTYVVTLTASNGGCSDTYTATIIVDQAISLVVPNVFSPNGDGINDEFGFIASGITALTCDIYNRWGQKVKTLNGPTDKWDGKLDNGHTASEGTYFYVVVATSFDSKPHNSQGSLTIVK